MINGALSFATSGALKGINPAVIPHEERGDSSNWYNRKYLDTPVSAYFYSQASPDDK